MRTPTFLQTAVLAGGLAGCPKPVETDKPFEYRTPVPMLTENLHKKVQACMPEGLEAMVGGTGGQPAVLTMSWDEAQSIYIPREALSDADVRLCLDNAMLSTQVQTFRQIHPEYSPGNLCSIQTYFNYEPDCRCMDAPQMVIACERN